MPIRQNILRKGKAPKQDLLQFDVFRDETGVLGDLTTSEFFNISDFPSVLPTGNSSFLIEGSNLLKPEVELKTEILDAQGNPIFHYAIPGYNKELPARRIAVEVYQDDVVNGVGTLTILGELNPKQFNIPTAFQNTYNVRFSAPISINKTIKNTEPIRFYGDPTISVSELVKGVAETVSSVDNLTTTITGSVEAIVDKTFIISTPPNTYIPDVQKFEEVGNSLRKYKGKKLGKNKQSSILAREPIPITTRRSVTYVLKELESSDDNSSNKLSSALKGATITFQNPNLTARDSSNQSLSSTKFTLPTTFETDILDLEDPITFTTTTDYIVTDNRTNRNQKAGLNSTPVTMSFESQNVGVVESQVFKRSFANMTVGNLQTFSGDTYKAKIYVKEDGSSGEFEPIYETLVESQNELVDVGSVSGFDGVGTFSTQSTIDNNWITSSNLASATTNDDTIIDGVLLSGSNEANGDTFTFVTKDVYSLQNNQPYLVEFKTAAKQADKTQSDGTTNKDARLEVFLTGPITSEIGEELSLGDVDLSEIDLSNNDFVELNKLQIADFQSHNLTSSPSGSLGFRVHAGEFILSDVRLRPFSETNFSPGFFKANVPMPKAVKRGQKYDFLVEFYDANNNLAEAVAIADDVVFNGPPQIIADGTDGLLTGSLFISNVTGSGIELHGGSAYMRSIGYNGFDRTIGENLGGFLIFSGSVSESMGTSQSYEGVGLEIVDAHGDTDRFLKFRTNPSEFTVQTDQFFLGKEGQFISGSNGNIVISSSNFFLGGESTFVSGSNDKLEISSSNFHLDDDGSVTMQGTITAEAGGTIGGFTIGASSLAAGNVFQLSSSQDIEDPASMISSSKFKVSAGGQLTGSDVLLSGGTITGATTITSDVTIQGSVSANSILVPATIAGSPSTIANASASIDDKGNAIFRSGSIGGFRMDANTLFSDSAEFVVTGSTGQITGSQVLFTGGKIGGFDMDAISIASSNGNLIMSSSGQITASSADLTGDLNATHIKAASGSIGGFDLSSTTFNSTDGNISLNSSQKALRIANDTFGNTGIQLEYNSGTPRAHIGKGDGEGFKFDGANVVMSSSAFLFGSRAGGNAFVSGSNGEIEISGSAFHLFKGNITASNVDLTGAVTATSGEIAGWEIDSNILKSGTNIQLDSGNKKITITDQTFGNTGIQLDHNSGTPRAHIGKSDGEGFKFDGTNVVMSSSAFLLGSRAGGNSFVSGSNGEIEISGSSFHLLKGTITASNVDLSGRITAEEGEIGGFAITENAISSSNNELILRGDGPGTSAGQITGSRVLFSGGEIGGFLITNDTIETKDFVSGLKGVRLSTSDNGSLEVEEARIRGTLKTTVFEKETVNAVGGQLIVANSTAITGSDVAKTDTTMSVENVTGFAADEILLIKKVSGSGFSTEYVQVISSSNDFNSDTNFQGKLMVSRSFGSSATYNPALHSGSITTTTATGSTYTTGQVIVSTGKINTGFIKLNANPNDSATPFIDIVERTGSGVFDVDLKARLGDLSGLSSGLVGSSPGFGLFSENVFLTGKITATSGEIAGWEIDSNILKSGTNIQLDSGNEKITISDQTFGNTGIQLEHNSGTPRAHIGKSNGEGFKFDGTNVVMSASAFQLGNNATFVSGSNGNVKISGSSVDIQTPAFIFGDLNKAFISGSNGNLELSASNFILGTSASNAAGGNTGVGAYVSSSNNNLRISSSGFDLNSIGNVGTLNIANGKLTFDGSDLSVDGTITANDGTIGGFHIGSTSLHAGDNGIGSVNTKMAFRDITNGGVPKFSLGTSANSITLTSGDGVYMDGGGDFRVGDADGERIQFDLSESELILSASAFKLGNQTSFVSGSNGNVKISGSSIDFQTPAFVLGDLNKAFISGSNGNLELSASNFILGTSGSNAAGGETGVGAYVSASNGKLRISASNFDLNDNGNFDFANGKLTFNGSTLSVNGNITIGNPGDIDISTINNDSGFTDDTAANSAQSTANTANSAASTAQAAVDVVESRVIITSADVTVAHNSGHNKGIFNAAGLTVIGNNQTGSIFGNFGAEIYGASDKKERTLINPTGVSIIANNITGSSFTATTSSIFGSSDKHERVEIVGTGMNVYQNNAQVANFGATTTIGNTATEHIRISGSGFELKDGSTQYIGMDANGMSIGNNIVLATNGNATFNGTVQIGGTSLNSTNTLNTNTTAGDVGLGNVENKNSQTQAQDGLISGVTLTGGGITIGSGGSIKSSGKDNLADNTAGFFLGHDGSSGYDFAIGNASQFMKFDGSTGTLSVAGTITIANPGDIDISDLNNDSGFTDDTAANSAQSTANSANTAAGNAQTTANTANTAAGNAQAAVDTIEEKVVIGGSSVSVQQNSSNKAVLTTSGVELFQGGTSVSNFGSTVRVGPDANSKSRVEIDSGAVKIINKDGSGNDTTMLNFKSDGDIESGDFLIERTRLFGAGGDGDIVLKSNDCTVANGGTKVSNASIKDERGDTVCTRSGATWTMKGDWYTKSLEIDNSVSATTLVTNGYRLFVQGTLTIDSSCIIHNDGADGSNGGNSTTTDTSGGSTTPTAGGAGGGESGCSLGGGPDGKNGSRGGESDNEAGGTPAANYFGAHGGGGGGGGGIVFISCRTITNNGTIRSNGGDGGNGGNGGQGGVAAGAGTSGGNGSVVHVKI